MLLLYTIGIKLYTFLIWILSFFNIKAKQFIEGRKNTFHQLSKQLNIGEKYIWFHFASLGEFEQGRPVLEKIKALHPQKKIVITFFSPSGYEARKNYALAEGVFYLPMDTRKNAAHFIRLINPEMAIFTKYEFWNFYFKTLHQKQIPLYLISGIFRKDQVFFKWYGGFYRDILKYVDHFFVQNTESATLLKSIGITAVSVNGDTRFDRVYENARSPKKMPEIEQFIDHSPALICGSTWPEDEKLLSAIPEQYPSWKFIIAPHELSESHLHHLESLFKSTCIRYSKLAPGDAGHKQVLLIDNIGMLSSLYQYGKVAYIGGGFGSGIHNTLEAVAFGVPVIFGPKYDKFQEAKDLIKIGAALSITNLETLSSAFEQFKDNAAATQSAAGYIIDKKGATATILNSISL